CSSPWSRVKVSVVDVDVADGRLHHRDDRHRVLDMLPVSLVAVAVGNAPAATDAMLTRGGLSPHSLQGRRASVVCPTTVSRGRSSRGAAPRQPSDSDQGTENRETLAGRGPSGLTNERARASARSCGNVGCGSEIE